MKRRDVLAGLLAVCAMPPTIASAGAGRDALPEDVTKALADGKTVFIDVYADWCTTCARQERVIDTLLRSDPTYSESVAFLSLDWDTHKSSELFDQLNVPRRSTLLVLKGNEEFGRIVAGTSRGTIKELMDRAVAVAREG